jgi:parafibromin
MVERVKPLRELLKTQKTGATGILTPAVSSGGTFRSSVFFNGNSPVPVCFFRSAADRPKKQRAAQQNIILLSSSPTALITMWNVKRFLEEGVYVPSLPS